MILCILFCSDSYWFMMIFETIDSKSENKYVFIFGLQWFLSWDFSEFGQAPSLSLRGISGLWDILWIDLLCFDTFFQIWSFLWHRNFPFRYKTPDDFTKKFTKVSKNCINDFKAETEISTYILRKDIYKKCQNTGGQTNPQDLRFHSSLTCIWFSISICRCWG